MENTPVSRQHEAVKPFSLKSALAFLPSIPRQHVLPSLLQRWSHGIIIGSSLFAVAATIIRGAYEIETLHVIVGISLAALVWAYGLIRLSRRAWAVRHMEGVLWANSLVVLTLMTVMLATTGGCLSPLAWLYLTLIISELLQDMRRGIAMAWLCWLAGDILLGAQAIGWLPSPYRIVSVWLASLAGPTWLVHALSLNVWYLLLAIGVSFLGRWIGRHLQQIEEERAALRTAQEEIGMRTFQLDHERRRLEESSQHLEQERIEWNVQQLQAAQRIAAQEAKVAERARELEELKHHFEAQHVQTTQLFMQLEGTLMTTVRRISEEIGRLESKYREIEETQRALLPSHPSPT